MEGAAVARGVRLEAGGPEEQCARRWHLPLRDVYRRSLAFYKDKEGKALHLSYEDKLKLVAYTQQAAHGSFDEKTAPPLGVLDMIGRDRRAAWLALADMTQLQAMAGFIHTLDRLCPLFKTYLEAIQKDVEEKQLQEKRKNDDEKSQLELQNRLQLEKEKQLDQKLSEEQQVRRIKDALNAQTYEQFLQYAQQQFPGNFDQQAVLIRQLQDQHYHQYVQQLAVDQRLAGSVVRQSSEDSDNGNKENDSNLNRQNEQLATETKSMQTSEKPLFPDISKEDPEESEGDDIFPPIEEANMWTRGDLPAFKSSVRSSGGMLTVGHGETLTVRVPTHRTGRCLFWEFATDSYDLGFGVYFEWSKSSTSEVTIHMSESEEEEEEADDDDEELTPGLDVESGSKEGSPQESSSLKAPISIVVPIYRRDCHLEVYAGSHTYPGEGVYLLKFDNTYSLWRSKTLYYKVYYTH